VKNKINTTQKTNNKNKHNTTQTKTQKQQKPTQPKTQTKHFDQEQCRPKW